MITIGYCTRESNIGFTEHLIKTSGLHNKVQVIEIVNKGNRSLTECYNEILKKAQYNIVVFTHSDLTLETKQWGHKLLKQFDKNPEFGIIGVAGSKFMSASGQWWENKKKMYGRVAHTHEGKTWLSAYSVDQGQELEEVVVVDGVFFAVDKSKIKVTFNESVEGFHFYDVTFGFENYLKGVKVGVTTMIRVNHKSIGMTNEKWEENRIQFATTFKDNLPVEIKKVLRKGQKLKVLIGCMSLNGESPEEKYTINLINKLKTDGCDISLVSNINKKYLSLMNNLGVKVFSIQEPPSFKLGDGKWSLKSAQGDAVSQLNTLYKLSDINFDVIYLSQKPVVDHLLRLYPDTEAICSILSTDRTTDEPVISPQVIKYIAIDNTVKEVLVEDYGIDKNLIVMAEKKTEVVTKLKKGPIKIITGWSNKGGSTSAFIALTNCLNKAGYDTTLYGPHTWHLDKCKSALHDKFNVTPNDRIIAHFTQLSDRPNAGKVILSCHEKNMYEVGKVPQFWDEAVFINQRHKDYHGGYKGKFTIIPNLKESFIKHDKTGLEKIAGIIGSFDENKQTHVSIQRALSDGMEKILLFGEPSGSYYEQFVKPLVDESFIIFVKGFITNKQEMYDSIGCVYHTSKSEVACLVKDECESAGVEFKGNEATDNPPVLLTNDEILNEWIKILEL